MSVIRDDAIENALQQGIERTLRYRGAPPDNWVEPAAGTDHDVLIVGGDQGIAFDQLAGPGSHGDHAVGLGKALDGLAQVQVHARISLSGFPQQLLQIGPVDGGVGRAIALHGLAAQGHMRQFLSGDCAAHAQAARQRHHLLQRFLQAPGLKPPHDIRTDLDSGAHFTERGRLLEKTHFPTRPRRTDGGGQATNAAAGNQHLLVHVRIVPLPPPMAAGA